MANPISEDDWQDFINVVATSVKSHQEPGFIDTVALSLKGDVYNKFQDWKFSLHGVNATMDLKVQYVLTQWKSCQTQHDLNFLVNEFDSRLSKDKFANELRTNLTSHFNDRIKENGLSTERISQSPTHQKRDSKPEHSLPSIGANYGTLNIQLGEGKIDNSNQGVGSVVGNANQVSGQQGTAQYKRNSTKDLQEVMKDANIGDLYSKFESKGVTVDVIWELPDKLVNDFLELNDMERLRYQTAKKKFAHST